MRSYIVVAGAALPLLVACGQTINGPTEVAPREVKGTAEQGMLAVNAIDVEQEDDELRTFVGEIDESGAFHISIATQAPVRFLISRADRPGAQALKWAVIDGGPQVGELLPDHAGLVDFGLLSSVDDETAAPERNPLAQIDTDNDDIDNLLDTDDDDAAGVIDAGAAGDGSAADPAADPADVVDDTAGAAGDPADTGAGDPADSGAGAGDPADSGAGAGDPADTGAGASDPADSGAGAGAPADSGAGGADTGAGDPADSGAGGTDSGAGAPADSGAADSGADTGASDPAADPDAEDAEDAEDAADEDAAADPDEP